MFSSEKVILSVLVLASIGSLAGCMPAGNDLSASPRLAQEEIAESVTSAMDSSADPCNDFYQYACGGWLAKTELPGDESRWSRSFSVISKRNRETLRDILEQASGSDDSEIKRMGDYYASCMDEETVERLGLQPLQPMFDEIAKVENAGDLLEVTGNLHASQVDALFAAGVFGDLKQPDVNLTNFFQGGLGLPDRDYYLDASKQGELAAYQKHLERMFGLIGEDDPAAAAEQVLAFESEIARVSRTATAMRDVEKLYHKIDRSGLEKSTPSLPWARYFDAIEYAELRELNVGTPEFFEGLDRLVATTPAETLQNYLRWQLLNQTSARLPEDFVEASFDFFARTLQGQQEMRPRWRRCIQATTGAMGELVGRAFVERQFPGDSKQIAVELISGIERAFESGLPELAWMDGKTRERSVEKMEALRQKIGYPDRWRDYSSIVVKQDDYFGNALRADHFEFRRNMDKAGRPVDPTEWGMPPSQVNAYYNPLVNEIVFPAGILQRPFFHRDFPAAMNFGGIGMVMGHELTHGFDDMGSKFDSRGKMAQWWEDEAIERFEERTSCVEQLYSNYEVQPGLNVNGKLTLGENIADLGGIKEAFRAYKAHQAGAEESSPSVAGLDEDRLFFVAFAQTWCQKATPQIEKMLVAVDSHSPARFRVVGPLANLPEFAEAFDCPAGSPMNPEEKCEVW